MADLGPYLLGPNDTIVAKIFWILFGFSSVFFVIAGPWLVPIIHADDMDRLDADDEDQDQPDAASDE